MSDPLAPPNASPPDPTFLSTLSTPGVAPLPAGRLVGRLHTIPRFSHKRPLALSGISSTVEERNPDYLCPVCFDLIRDPTLTRCGHSFCYECIFKSIGNFQRCPKCNTTLTSAAHIFPNRLLGELITKYENRLRAIQHINAAQPPDIMDMVGTSATTTTMTSAATAAPDGTAPATSAAADARPMSAAERQSADGLRHFIASESEKLGLTDVQAMLDILQQRKQMLEAESTIAQNSLLHEFLRHLLHQKREQAQHLQREIDLVQSDMHEVQAMLSVAGDQPTEAAAATPAAATCDNAGDATAAVATAAADEGEAVPGTPPPPVVMTKEVIELLDRMDTTPPQSAAVGAAVATAASPALPIGEVVDSSRSQPVATSGCAGFNSMYNEAPSVNYLTRKRRLYAHFDDFVQSYFSVRSRDLHLPAAAAADDTAADTAAAAASDVSDAADAAGPSSRRPSATAGGRHGLDVFRENLVKFSRYNTLRPLATMYYSSDLQTSSTIVSSIVFDKDNEFFAIGGVTKRIKVFDYMAVVRDTVDIHYPSIEMMSTSKISCIAWNSYHKHVLATSDYEGIVSIWDVNTGQRKSSLHEHEKRCWSVDFNEVDTRLIASGSDDARVKLWSTNDDRSIATLEAKANVCCVKFNPKSSCHLAFGSADHDVHYYDLRNMSKALCVFKGHKKAVSYVKFLGAEEIISASTDSQLKLWNVNRPPHCLRSFTGHVNEKNFVGLATDGDYVACGSEDNALYVYYKGLSKQLFNYRIDAGVVPAKGGLGADGVVSVEPNRVNDANEFLSAVCWRKGCNVVLAANSRGLIKVFELI